jgi:hypothetical protein
MRRPVKFDTIGRVVDGELKILNVSRLRDWADCDVTVVVERFHATRSLDQNAMYHGLIVRMLSEHTGFTHDEMHEVLKAKFLPKHLSVPNQNGEIVGEFVIGGSTTKLNKLEFGEYCDSIVRWAAEDLGLVIPDPDPAWREKRSA